MHVGFIIIIAFAVFISLFFYFQQWDNISSTLVASTTLSNTTTQMLQMHQNNIFDTWDGVLAMIFFGAFFSIIAAAYFIRTHIGFLFVGILVVAIFTFVAAVFSNAYYDMISRDAAFNSFVTTNFSLSHHIMMHYPLYAVVLGMLLLISLYAKIQGAPSS